MAQSKVAYTDVLIVGAGPGGLMAAQALARLGIQVKLVDRRAPKEVYGNGDGIMPRTIEIWESYGLFDRIYPKGCPLHVMVGYERHEGGIVRSVPTTNVVIPARFRFEFTAAAETMEKILRESMEEHGCQLSYRTTPIQMDVCDPPNSSGTGEKLVKVVLQHLSGSSPIPSERDVLNTETVFAKYVIGADGAHSWVRRHFNIPMEGDQTEDCWGAADVIVDTNFPDFRSKCVIQAPTGALIIIPREDDKIRIYVQFPPKEAPRTEDGRFDRSVSSEVAIKMISEKVKAGFKPYKMEFTNVYWCTIFTVSQMVAAKYSIHDKVFIVGDACHTHSPKAGQGANASMGDAHNLLAHVLRKWADPSILQTYEIERRGYAQELIALDKIVSTALDGGTAAQYKKCVTHINSSGIGIKYQSSLIKDTGLPKGATHLEAGYRIPTVALGRLTDWRPMDLQDLAPSNGLFKIFLFPGDILVDTDAKRFQEFSDALGIYTILNSDNDKALWSDVPNILRDWKRCVVVVRPDGHVSVVTTMSPSSAQGIIEFLVEL
ncbi:FAD binding domain-containing protein [Mycena leptocephala]|nr:FAD binding domain-containing protein [Mycena leptocephala]